MRGRRCGFWLAVAVGALLLGCGWWAVAAWRFETDLDQARQLMENKRFPETGELLLQLGGIFN